jgi:hypothetical protein
MISAMSGSHAYGGLEPTRPDRPWLPWIWVAVAAVVVVSAVAWFVAANLLGRKGVEIPAAIGSYPRVMTNRSLDIETTLERGWGQLWRDRKLPGQAAVYAGEGVMVAIVADRVQPAATFDELWTLAEGSMAHVGLAVRSDEAIDADRDATKVRCADGGVRRSLCLWQDRDTLGIVLVVGQEPLSAVETTFLAHTATTSP